MSPVGNASVTISTLSMAAKLQRLVNLARVESICVWSVMDLTPRCLARHLTVSDKWIFQGLQTQPQFSQRSCLAVFLQINRTELWSVRRCSKGVWLPWKKQFCLCMKIVCPQPRGLGRHPNSLHHHQRLSFPNRIFQSMMIKLQALSPLSPLQN